MGFLLSFYHSSLILRNMIDEKHHSVELKIRYLAIKSYSALIAVSESSTFGSRNFLGSRTPNRTQSMFLKMLHFYSGLLPTSLFF